VIADCQWINDEKKGDIKDPKLIVMRPSPRKGQNSGLFLVRQRAELRTL
jgi:hypothetical protein